MAPLAEQLATLGLRYTAAHLDDVVALATKRRWSTTQLLEHLADTEHQERTRRSLERSLARSRVGRFTPMSEFDWAWPKRNSSRFPVWRVTGRAVHRGPTFRRWHDGRSAPTASRRRSATRSR